MRRKQLFTILLVICIVLFAFVFFFIFTDHNYTDEEAEVVLKESLTEISEAYNVEFGLSKDAIDEYNQLTKSEIDALVYELEVRAALTERLTSQSDEIRQSTFNAGDSNPVLSDGIGGTATISERYMLESIYEAFNDVLPENSYIDKSFSFSYNANQESEDDLLHFTSIPDFNPMVTGNTLNIEWDTSVKSQQLSESQTEVHFQTSGSGYGVII